MEGWVRYWTIFPLYPVMSIWPIDNDDLITVNCCTAAPTQDRSCYREFEQGGWLECVENEV